ncbi:MAG: DUF1223 domain-containing protein, partial [Acidobacteriaceae bacterium]|nr:DUF1223 domain-containing protein [Acidobacteriaceae bacterium]
HVDYWNSPAWSDPFSSSTYTERQQAYDSHLGVEAYTPQLVIDGASAVVGNNWPKAADAIQRVLHGEHIAVHVAATREEGKVKIDVAAGPNASGNKALVFLALAHDRTQSHVGGGENAGRDLSEVAVVYSMKQLGKMDGKAAFSKSISIDLPAKSQAGDLRVIAFVRNAGTMQVIGADQAVY